MPRKKERAEKVINNILEMKRIVMPKRTIGQIAADTVTSFCGSWKFIIMLFGFMFVWMYLNIRAWMGTWDPYPFILLNFVLSCLAAIQAPIILMSQNREAEREREKVRRDYKINRSVAKEIQTIKRDVKQLLNSLEGKKRKK